MPSQMPRGSLLLMRRESPHRLRPDAVDHHATAPSTASAAAPVVQDHAPAGSSASARSSSCEPSATSTRIWGSWALIAARGSAASTTRAMERGRSTPVMGEGAQCAPHSAMQPGLHGRLTIEPARSCRSPFSAPVPEFQRARATFQQWQSACLSAPNCGCSTAVKAPSTSSCE